MRRLATASDYHLGALPLRTAFIGSAAAWQGNYFSHGQIWVARASDTLSRTQPQPRPPSSVRIEAQGQVEVQALLAEFQQEQDRLVLPRQEPRKPVLAASRPSPLRLAVVRDAQLRVVACGTLLLHEEYAELGQLMVHPLKRRQGLGQLLLEKLESEAILARRPLLRIEADVRQHPVQHLCERSRFQRCSPFDGRRAYPFGVFMEKLLCA